MGGRLKDRVDSTGVDVGLGLEDGSTPAFDFVSPVGQATEECSDLLTNSGLGAEAGVRCDFRAEPAPDVLVRVEVRAVGRQSDQAEPQARCRQVGTQWVTTMRRTSVPNDDQRLGMVRPQTAARRPPRSRRCCCPPVP